MISQLQRAQAKTLSEAEAILNGGVLDIGPEPFAAGTSERSLEVLFAAKYLRDAKEILDLGFTFSSLDYLGLLLSAQDRGANIQAYDIVTPKRVAERYPEGWRDRVMAVPFTQADIRTVSLPSGKFDICMCISTLEHIGFDEASDDPNTAFKRGATREEAPASRSLDTDDRVLSQFASALKPRGKAIITVPVGRGGPVMLQDSKGLFTRQWEYEANSLAKLTSHADLSCIEERYYRETPEGWIAVGGPADLEDVSSADRPHAAGCGLLAFCKR